MRYFTIFIIILLVSSCKKQLESSQSVVAQMTSIANYESDWFPKLNEEQLLIIEVEKHKYAIIQLLVLESVEQALEEIYYRDQIYCDSINNVPDLDKTDMND